jgi:HEPN domain-containing protein
MRLGPVARPRSRTLDTSLVRADSIELPVSRRSKPPGKSFSALVPPGVPWHRFVVVGMPAHARTWFEQAEADLRAGHLSATGGAYEWACFQAQQAGEKALKALLYARGFTTIVTHSLRRLARECEALDASFRVLGEPARLLDQHYIPTRYPSGLDEEVPPSRYYEKGDADACLQSAHSILERVRPFFTS